MDTRPASRVACCLEQTQTPHSTPGLALGLQDSPQLPQGGSRGPWAQVRQGPEWEPDGKWPGRPSLPALCRPGEGRGGLQWGTLRCTPPLGLGTEGRGSALWLPKTLLRAKDSSRARAELPVPLPGPRAALQQEAQALPGAWGPSRARPRTSGGSGSPALGVGQGAREAALSPAPRILLGSRARAPGQAAPRPAGRGACSPGPVSTLPGVPPPPRRGRELTRCLVSVP